MNVRRQSSYKCFFCLDIQRRYGKCHCKLTTERMLADGFGDCIWVQRNPKALGVTFIEASSYHHTAVVHQLSVHLRWEWNLTWHRPQLGFHTIQNFWRKNASNKQCHVGNGTWHQAVFSPSLQEWNLNQVIALSSETSNSCTNLVQSLSFILQRMWPLSFKLVENLNFTGFSFIEINSQILGRCSSRERRAPPSEKPCIFGHCSNCEGLPEALGQKILARNTYFIFWAHLDRTENITNS